MMRPGVGWAVLALALAVGCRPDAPPEWHDEATFRWRELVVRDGAPGFTRMDAGRTTIDFTNTVSDSALLGNRILGQGAGVSLGDVDGDGRIDVFLARTEGSSRLYRNLGDWRFADITDSAGVGMIGRHVSGSALADIDGDDDLDLVALATTGPNAVFANDGHGRFTERRDLGLDTTGRGGTTLAMADVDGDADLDLYVANYKAFSPADSISPQAMAFNQLVHQVAPGRFDVRPQYQRDFKLIMRADLGGMFLTMRAEPDQFYLNEGGRFSEVRLDGDRFRDTSGRPMATVAESFTLGARFADLNGDMAPDLYVANDFEDPDQLMLNDGRGIFRMLGWRAQRQMSNSSMGIDVGDINGDGLPDLFEVDMLSSDTRRLRTQMPTHTPAAKRAGDLESQPQLQRNTLFLNRGDSTFAEISDYAGVQASGWSWATMLMDVDLDGWQDILIANGHLWDLMDADTQERLQNRLGGYDWRRFRWEFPRLPLRNVAYRNRGDLTFEDVGARWGFGTGEDISHAMAAGDLDGDGDLDLVVNRLDSTALVLRNNTSANRVAVRLRGDSPNTRAVGAKVRVLGGAIPLQEREVAVGGLYLSHSDYLASFGTGAAERVTIVVDWRDGRRTVIADARPNRLYEITTRGAADRPDTDSRDTSRVEPLFEDATARLGGHVHTETAFDDWSVQSLLPNALSQLGPGVAWFDLDRDGDEDLLVGTGKGGRLGMFMNENGRLARRPSAFVAAAGDLTTILGFVDGGRTRVLAGVSTWEARTERERMDQPAAISLAVTRGGVAAAGEPLVGSTESAVGPLALGDYDGDGDLDLFVGGRAIPQRYPDAASSGLFRNDSGRFILDSAGSAALRRVGLVSAALFADVNGDGRADLALAREWGALLLLLNDGRGGFSAAPESWGLARWTSRWNGLASGDLDGDGRLDLIATSWGRNTATPADSARPLVLVHGPFGGGGATEMLMAREDPRVGGLAPLNSFAQARLALPDLVTRLRTFGAYADATIDGVLGPNATRAQRLTASTLDHMIFFNRGDRFDAVPLPAEAQLAPAFSAGIADFDGDGSEDVFLSQNFFPTSIGTPRYDAGRGLLLLGDGRGGLRPMPGTRAGIIVYGDQRGAAYADFDRDGRLDLVVAQNGAPTRLFRNRGAAPGLRVRLEGSDANPDAIGAQVRALYGDRSGPVRELHAGSGYWSQNGAVQLFGGREALTGVAVRWPGGLETRVPVPRGVAEIVVRKPR